MAGYYQCYRDRDRFQNQIFVLSIVVASAMGAYNGLQMHNVMLSNLPFTAILSLMLSARLHELAQLWTERRQSGLRNSMVDSSHGLVEKQLDDHMDAFKRANPGLAPTECTSLG